MLNQLTNLFLVGSLIFRGEGPRSPRPTPTYPEGDKKMMKFLIAFLAVLLLFVSISCGHRSESSHGPKYGNKDLEVVLPKSLCGLVNCLTKDFRIPWGASHETATIVLLAKQKLKESVVRLRSAPVTHELIRFEYEVTKVTKGKFPKMIVSFFSFEVYEDGIYYKRLVMPDECRFFLVSFDGKYRIVSVR